MNREDLKERLAETDDTGVGAVLESLESESLVALYRDNKRMIGLVKATYEGLRKTDSMKSKKGTLMVGQRFHFLGNNRAVCRGKYVKARARR